MSNIKNSDLPSSYLLPGPESLRALLLGFARGAGLFGGCAPRALLSSDGSLSPIGEEVYAALAARDINAPALLAALGRLHTVACEIAGEEGGQPSLLVEIKLTLARWEEDGPRQATLRYGGGRSQIALEVQAGVNDVWSSLLVTSSTPDGIPSALQRWEAAGVEVGRPA
jgi:hypothetical protein